MRWLDGIADGHEFEKTPGDSEGQEDRIVKFFKADTSLMLFCMF